MSLNILRIDSSARYDDSVSRDLATRLIERLNPDGDGTVVERDLTAGVSLLDEPTVSGMFSDPAGRTDEQIALLAEGAALIDELRVADAVVIAMPIYNFGPPASLKAWADLVARERETFRETESGLEGLLDDRPVYLIVTSGGVPISSAMDFATEWMRFFLGFLGITTVHIVPAGELTTGDEQAQIAAARQAVDEAPLPN